MMIASAYVMMMESMVEDDDDQDRLETRENENSGNLSPWYYAYGEALDRCIHRWFRFLHSKNVLYCSASSTSQGYHDHNFHPCGVDGEQCRSKYTQSTLELQ